jgi:Zn-dependent M28 family amino/carboxypeptidase
MRSRHSFALGLACSVLLAGAAAGSVGSRPHSSEQRPRAQVSPAGVREHLVALQAIAERHGGTRLSGTPGFDDSARYVARRMRAAGYAVRVQEFVFPVVLDRSPPTLRTVGAGAREYRAGRDFSTLGYSGNGRVEAPVAAVDLLVPSPRANASTSACESADFAGFPRGAVALIQRGTCTFRQKVAKAIEAGASAAVVFNEGNEGRRELFAGTIGAPQVRIPVLGASFAVGDDLRRGSRAGATGVTVALGTDVIAERRRTRNVIAESRRGRTGNVVVVGAHLDSVQQGPGINDNGSGSAVILEVAEELAATSPRNKLRFVWWGAEELGLLGSRHYVRTLSGRARRQIALYLNVDMVGSRNFVRFVYDGDGSTGREAPAGSAAIERVFSRYFRARGLPHGETALGGASDHAPFAAAGIPVGGVFSGADGQKSSSQASKFGGRAGQPYDPCYHRECDTLANVNATAVDQLGDAVAHAVARFARDTSRVNGR